ncbi:MAG: TetR/AcrR family transcriptional regulator [Candidatus Polarisedimenticolia bacterium]|nr:TetR/AcrR family transcriptional regulator [bacterium]
MPRAKAASKRAKGERNPEKTQELLRAAASRLFAERGFDGATADDIAAAAGVNKAMINYHFGGKEGLYTAILADVLATAKARMAPLHDPATPAGEKLAYFLRGFAELQNERPDFARMMLHEILSGGRFLDKTLFPRFLAVFGEVRAVLEQGEREGTFRKTHPLVTHLSLIGAMLFFFGSRDFRARVFDQLDMPVTSPTNEEFVAHMQRLALHGLAPAAAPAAARSPRKRG